jgi:formate hydrogenlyase subunit 6/NADH:ubiquinone oxidoreductase subunit I
LERSMAATVEVEKCNACLKCAAVCPMRIIDKVNNGEKDHARIKSDECIDCYACVAECPTGAMREPSA